MTASIPLRMKFSGRRDRGGLRKVEAPSRFELEQSGICSPLPYHLAMAPYGPPPWQGGALPNELCPQMVPQARIELATRGFSVRCSTY